MSGRRVWAALCLVAVLGPGALGEAKQGKPVKPTRTWAGTIGDNEALQKQSPAAGYIAGPAAWEKLWKAWRPGQELPQVDFSRELVLVATAGGPNRVAISPSLDDKGDLKVL